MADWVRELERRAPDVVAVWRGIDGVASLSVRREIRRRAGEGSASRVAVQLAELTDALAETLQLLPDAALRLPGGEEDWSVSETIGHDVKARVGLTVAASQAATGRWAHGAPIVVPSVPGPPGSTREELIRKLAQSQRLIDLAAKSVAGYEASRCPLEHPLVGRLRCGEWLLFAGVHDLMHLEQLHLIVARQRGSRSAATH